MSDFWSRGCKSALVCSVFENGWRTSVYARFQSEVGFGRWQKVGATSLLCLPFKREFHPLRSSHYCTLNSDNPEVIFGFLLHISAAKKIFFIVWRQQVTHRLTLNSHMRSSLFPPKWLLRRLLLCCLQRRRRNRRSLTNAQTTMKEQKGGKEFPYAYCIKLFAL